MENKDKTEPYKLSVIYDKIQDHKDRITNWENVDNWESQELYEACVDKSKIINEMKKELAILDNLIETKQYINDL